MNRDIKFCHVDADRKDHLLEAPILVAGIYNWHRLFGGEFLEPAELDGRENEYDVIYCSLTTWDTQIRLLQRIREKITGDTKIVVSVDYSTEMWHQAFKPELLRAELEAADLIVSPHPATMGYFKVIAPDVPCKFLAMPINTNAIRQYKRPRSRREGDCTYMIHRYDNLWWPGYWIQDYLKRNKVKTELYLVLANPDIGPEMIPYFKHIGKGGEFSEYIKWQAKRESALDGYQVIHSYGRYQADNACLGVPTVGSKTVYCQNLLWPDLACDPNDIIKMAELLKRLHDDSEFWNHCVTYAENAVDYLGYDKRREDFLEVVYGEAEIQTDGRPPEAGVLTREDETDRRDGDGNRGDGDKLDVVLPGKLRESGIIGAETTISPIGDEGSKAAVQWQEEAQLQELNNAPHNRCDN